MIDQLVLEEKSPNIISFPTNKNFFNSWIKEIFFSGFFSTSVFILFHIAHRKNAIKLPFTETEVFAFFLFVQFQSWLLPNSENFLCIQFDFLWLWTYVLHNIISVWLWNSRFLAKNQHYLRIFFFKSFMNYGSTNVSKWYI